MIDRLGVSWDNGGQARFDKPGLSHSDLQQCLLQSYQLVIANFLKRKQLELKLGQE
jgi:hypothetical protein